MARVSKKVSAAQREAENAQHRIWKTAIYARLSDFDDVLRNTESLEVQISYIKEYINHRDDLMLLDVFADKRCTGMNFDRPEFERLLKALQERKVNCIVVKDFSRLGRNFVETGQYLEQVFPLFGVRVIAINDNYDSLNSQSRDGMLVPIKSMINEMYSKDLSKKIRLKGGEQQMIGTYYRLSFADEDVGTDKAESNSIQGQRGLVEGYIMARPELATEPRQEYVDDGYSGTSTSRPAFQQLIQDAQDGKIKTIIVKDFSRFARDYIEAGDYMERIFPLLGVRFISVNDEYDSGMQAGNDVRGLEVAIKNIINASYSRDLSAKIAAADHVMQKKGMYLGGYRPFGFLPDPNDCHKLILDPVASRYVRLIFELALQGNRTGTIAKILNEKQIPTPAAYHVAENHVYSEQKAWDLQRSHWTSGTVYHVLKNEKYKGTYVGAKFIMPVPCKHRVLRAPLEQQVRIEDSHAAIVTPEEFEQAQMVIMLQHGKHQAGNYTKRQYPLKGKVYCGYCQKLMKYRVLKKLGPSFNCRFSATAVDSPCKRIPISEELLEEIVRNALTVQIKQAEHVLEILHERERKALICFSALERQEEKLSAEKAEIVKQRIALYEQYADGNISKEEFVRQRDAYRAQEDERMEQIQRLRAEKNQIFLPVRKDADNLQTVVSAAEEAGDVMRLSQNVVETFIDRIEVFNDERVKIRFTFEDVLAGYAE